MLTERLPARRTFWAERCVWTAAMLKEATGDDSRDWIDFALVARDLAGNEPLETLPIAKLIAEASVEVFATQRGFG